MRLYDIMTPLGGCGSIQEAKSWFGSSGTSSRVNSSGMVGTVRNERNNLSIYKHSLLNSRTCISHFRHTLQPSWNSTHTQSDYLTIFKCSCHYRFTGHAKMGHYLCHSKSSNTELIIGKHHQSREYISLISHVIHERKS